LKEKFGRLYKSASDEAKIKNARPPKSYFERGLLKVYRNKIFDFFPENFLWNLIFSNQEYHTPVVPRILGSMIFNL
jgi:hypothetical protein